MFDTTAYERVRAKYHAEGKSGCTVVCSPVQDQSCIQFPLPGAFPHLYDKTKPEIDVVAVGRQFIEPLS